MTLKARHKEDSASVMKFIDNFTDYNLKKEQIEPSVIEDDISKGTQRISLYEPPTKAKVLFTICVILLLSVISNK